MNIKEHELITKSAYKLAYKEKIETDSNKLASIMAGVKFNDVKNYTTLGFILRYLNYSDMFLNESHRGSLQSLHVMDSTGSAKDNYLQQLAYAKFCMEVFENKRVNGQNIQNMLLYDYVKNSDSIFQKIFYPLFMNHSSYSNMTIKDFFTGQRTNLDVGFIALGSLAHLLEDSFSNSHAQRTDNVLLEKSNYLQVIQNQQMTEDFLTNPDKILSGITPILLHQNYNEQNSLVLFGKHNHGDVFEKSRNANNVFITQGAMQALLSVSYLFRALEEGKYLEVIGFIEKVLEVDYNAMLLDEINQRRKKAESIEVLNELAEQSDAFLGLDFGKHVYSFTKGGRQYEHTFDLCFGKDKAWMRREKNPAVKKLLAKYNSLLNEETYNKIFTAEQLYNRYAKQVELMTEVFSSINTNKEIRERLSNHAMELLVHIASLIRQCDEQEPEKVAKLKQLRSTLVDAINNAFDN